MALTVDLNYKGIPVMGAYVTIVAPSISVGKDTITCSVWYRSSQDAEVYDFGSLEVLYDLEGENPFIQAYQHLKALAEFEGSIDC